MSSGSRKVKRVPSCAMFFQGFIRSSSVVVSPPPFLGGFHPVRNITGKSIPALCFLVQPWSKLFIKLVQKS